MQHIDNDLPFEKELFEKHPELFRKNNPVMDKRALGFAGILMQDKMNREAGKVAPDTIGADKFFLEGFITEDMAEDFPEIAREFLLHCYPDLKEYADKDWYENDDSSFYEPVSALRNRILNLIYNGARSGDLYAKPLIIYLYKTYHKKEYNQLKRFKKIGMHEILSLSESSDDFRTEVAVGRILSICPFLGIEIDEMCSLLYLSLEKQIDEYKKYDKELQEFEGFKDGLYRDCMDTIEKWWEENKGRDGHVRIDRYFDTSEFVGTCFRYEGYPDDYADRCNYYAEGLKSNFVRTLALLRTCWPKKDFSFDDVQIYATLFEFSQSLISLSDEIDDLTTDILGIRPGRYMDDRRTGMFIPEKICPDKPVRKESANIHLNIAPVESSKAVESDYLAEIERLRSKLHEEEQKSRELRELYKTAKKNLAESSETIKKFEDDREELNALREYVYHLSEGADKEIPSDDMDQKRAFLNEKKIIIIGGHVSWHNKLKQLYPGWILISPDSYKGVPADIFRQCDKAYFFTDYINHTSYHYFINMIRTLNVPFGYLHERNIDALTRQIYNELNVSV